MERYQRQTDLSLVGKEGQEKLASAKVLIVGVGGLGCPAAQYLAASGIGTIGLIDHDKVELTNLQRQVLFGEKDLGENKALVASQKLSNLNSEIEYLVFEEKFSEKNAISMLEQFDLVIDGTDNFETKYLINDACLLTDTPMIYGSVYKFEGQVSVFNYQQGPSYRCVFPQHHDLDPNSCVETGVLGVLPGLVGIMQATEAIKIVLGIDEVLAGKMKILNALTNQEHMVNFGRNEEVISQVSRDGLTETAVEKTRVTTDEAIYIDVREPDEEPKPAQITSINIPMSQLEKRVNEVPRDQAVILFCQTGKRSGQALSFLERKYGFTNLHHLSGGVKELQETNG